MRVRYAGEMAATKTIELVTEIPGPRSREIGERLERAVASPLQVTFPIFAASARGAALTDVDGNTFIDFCGGVGTLNVGHNHPEVVAAAQEQLDRFVHTDFTVVAYEPYAALAERLAERVPIAGPLKAAFFNAGTEAVENAVKFARAFTGRPAVIAFEGAFHGRTLLALSLTSKVHPYKAGLGPFAPEIYRVPVAYPYRWLTGAENCAAEAAAQAIDIINKQIGADNVAAIIIEPIQGEGGFIEPAKGFLPAVVEYARANGIVFVADEIQTGFCRTGQWFACEDEGVVPDLITTAKGIAGGLPLAAVTGRAEIMDAAHAGGLGGTYGGNPVACAAALGAIETMKELDLNAKAQRIGEVMLGRLRAMAEKFDVIGDIRGRGAMIAIELVKPGSKEPNPEVTAAVAKACHAEGLVVLTAGTYGNVLRFLPPLVMPEHLLNEGLDIIEGAFALQGVTAA